MIKKVELKKTNDDEDILLNLRIGRSGDSVAIERDLFDPAPVFYSVINGGFVISDSFFEIRDYLKAEKETLKVNFDYISAYISYQAPFTSHTIYKDICVIRPGEMVISNNFGKQERVLRSFKKEAPGTAIGFRESITASLDKISINAACFHISSGLDSTLLAIRAAEIHADKTVRLATCTCRGEGADEELENIKRLADEIKADLRIYDFRGSDVFRKGSTLVRKCLGYPIAHPSHLVEFLLDEQIAKYGAKTIINGKGPDDCLAGYQWHLPEFEKAGVHQKRLTVTPRDDCERLFRKNNYQPEWGGWRNGKSRLTLTQRLIYDIQSLGEAWNIIHTAISFYCDVNITSPFMNSKLRRGLFSLDDNKKICNGVQKLFLRETFRDEYPDYIINFPKKGLRLDVRPYLLDYGEDELFRIIVGNVDFWGRLLNLSYVKKMVADTLNNRKNYGWQLWSLFCLQEVLSDFQ